MAISLLRAFILYSQRTKQLIMNDKPSSTRHNYNVVDYLLGQLDPDFVDTSNDDIEGAILSMFTQVIKDEHDYKKSVGEKFVPIAGKRLKAICRYRSYEITVQNARDTGNMDDVQNQQPSSEFVKFTPKNEEKFFKLLNVISKYDVGYSKLIRKIKRELQDYKGIVCEYDNQHAVEVGDQDGINHCE